MHWKQEYCGKNFSHRNVGLLKIRIMWEELVFERHWKLQQSGKNFSKFRKVKVQQQFTKIDSQSTVFILERNALLYHLEEILSFNLIYRMLGIDSEITEKGGSKTHVGMAEDRRNSGLSEWWNSGRCGRNGGVSEWRNNSPKEIFTGRHNFFIICWIHFCLIILVGA